MTSLPSQAAAMLCQAGLAARKTAKPSNSTDFRIKCSPQAQPRLAAELLACRPGLGNPPESLFAPGGNTM
jgi:hypothetical protein